ncbi:superinfection immunity protein [Pseudoalteromonas tunicata]|uniref:Superinfection immunity protein n=1 Tax=Pseudoalteromonas tunicata D2 TaxID=87626 RepID=A4CCI7_9GAMM|nr:superinfection immunity protein [Pseudoalteromonas tunicata]ATC93781.1 hypothetical protein PTUN_a1093 [Pseudoalteromonas tunicata]AXT29601.1 superinfection immunity protein [Pseudoalteromonas tunicata]EAR27280.1 hypothetical protein PTD2_14612 [Pseudoalteromonas tunicata D2]MDP4985087.1 superinfection immunity protein [Pseudoalteromonas tunicata]MDP5215062.1 superinfection immunity protein [Pseudoalteromonas tunicata]
MENFTSLLSGMSAMEYAIVIPLMLAIYFIPTILAFFFNRKYLKVIAIVNVPAGLSVIAWGGLIVVAVTGSASETLLKKLKLDKYIPAKAT